MFRLRERTMKTKEEIKKSSKNFKIFLSICAALVITGKILYIIGITIPNFSIVIPALVVIGAFKMPFRADENEAKTTKYIGIAALSTLFIFDLLIWGFQAIYLFTWPSFTLIWFLASRKKLSFTDKFSKTTIEATFTTAILILLYDVITAFGTWLLWGSITTNSLVNVYIAQIPFTLYHLSSLIFVPALIVLGKALTTVKAETSEPIKNILANNLKAKIGNRR